MTERGRTLGHDLALAIVLAVLLTAVAAAVWAPSAALVRAGVSAAVAVGIVYWVCGQAFGMPFTGMATDPNSGPLLVLLAFAYWPSPPVQQAPVAAVTSPAGAAA